MAISGCSSGLVATAVLALLVLPAQYYVPELGAAPVRSPAPAHAPLAALDHMFTQFPPLELFLAFSLLLLGLLTYLCEWIQRKIMERRIVKLNQYLSSSVERLRAWDAQQEQLETTLKLVQNATSEYNLLLYLLLRQHRCIASNCPPSNCFFDKGLEQIQFWTSKEKGISISKLEANKMYSKMWSNL